MNRKEDYRDMEKYHKACQRQHRRYYSKTSFLYPSHPWTAEEDALVIKHEITDSELSEKMVVLSERYITGGMSLKS